jgi:two-component system OmpR family sensor kinase/two-component system sensor histidine kinase BaeS
MSTTSDRQRSASRYVPFVIFILFSALLFVGGMAALLYLVFSKYSGLRNIWLLACGAPVILAIILFMVLFNLYRRFGKPLQSLFQAINTVEGGDLSVRVPEDRSSMFSELFKRFNRMVGELERAEQQRRNLTADIAHELRTPLHIIQGNLEGILDGVYQPTPEHIDNTLDETRLLTRLVNDLQTLSLAETGQLPLHPTQFRLSELIQDLVSRFSSQAIGLGVDLQTEITNPDQELTADYDRLNQVLSNLISNALRYTPRGGMVTLRTESSQDESQSTIRMTIQDTGSGISAEDLPFLFDRFWRGDRSRSERTHSGLGLAITRQLVRAHGGTIEAQSEVGKGSTFVIEIPQPMQER